MPETMTRGKNQVLFNYLPERTIEFPKGTAIARVIEIDGVEPQDINLHAVIRRIAREVRAWQEENRPALTDTVLNTPDNFELLSPESARSTLFPRVFWCQNRACGRIFDHENSNDPPRARCSACGTGYLVQMRFVTVHKCGFISALTPPGCDRCNEGRRHMALDTRGSERLEQFRWVCRSCGRSQGIWGGMCRQCNEAGRDRQLDVQLHRAGKTYFSHFTTLLNIPLDSLRGLFNTDENQWAILVGAKHVGLPSIASRTLEDIAQSQTQTPQASASSVSTSDLTEIMARMSRGEIDANQMAAEIQRLTAQADANNSELNIDDVRNELTAYSGVAQSIWTNCGYEMLEALLPDDIVSNRVTDDSTAFPMAEAMQLSSVELLNDFPIIIASYGYSRTDYRPDAARLNPFPHSRRTGKIPVFVDRIQADAIRLKLNHARICDWLAANGYPISLPSGSDQEASQKAFFVQLFHDINLFESIAEDNPIARMTFGALHTLTHLCIRQATLLCGLERTSLSEYILPHSLESIIYCNHRDGATIGALTAMFEQSISEWLNAVMLNRRCVYDPVCFDDDNSCHACTHLAETSCRFFNNNLSRAFLFGGRDRCLENIQTGLFDL